MQTGMGRHDTRRRVPLVTGPDSLVTQWPVSSQKEEKRGLGLIPSVRINHDAASPAPRGELPQAGYRRSFTGEDGLRRREGRRARHSTVHSGHIIMTLTRPAG